MEELKQAYQAIEILKKLGLPVSNEQRNALARLERKYLQSEIIPLIEEELKPMVEDMQNAFYLYISYNKEDGLRSNLIDSSPRTTHGTAASKSASAKSKSGQRAPRYKIRIVFPDGRAICHNQVLQTLIEVVEYANPDKVKALNLPAIAGYKFISKEYIEHPRYGVGQKLLSTGEYVQTYSDTDTKFNLILRINRELNLGLQVEKVLLYRQIKVRPDISKINQISSK